MNRMAHDAAAMGKDMDFLLQHHHPYRAHSLEHLQQFPAIDVDDGILAFASPFPRDHTNALIRSSEHQSRVIQLYVESSAGLESNMTQIGTLKPHPRSTFVFADRGDEIVLHLCTSSIPIAFRKRLRCFTIASCKLPG